jgi:signal transduction histidine kinase
MSLARRGLAQSVRGSVQDYAPQLMQDPHNVRETLADLVGQSNGGIRVCLSETVVRMIAHNEYTRTDTEFDLHSELEQLCGVRVALTIDFDVPQRILSDLNLILHSAENLTSNATKYGPDGSPVRLRISALPSRSRPDDSDSQSTTTPARSTRSCGSDSALTPPPSSTAASASTPTL